MPLTKADNCKLYRLKENGDVGRLEAPPLYDPGDPPVDDETGIVWVPALGKAEYWRYVKADEVEEVGEVVRAEVHSDDHTHEVDFDAVPWFEQAADHEIRELAAINWRGDYAADVVAEFFEETNPEIGALMAYLQSIQGLWSHKDCCGFECSVEVGDAMAWLQRHRPALWAELEAEDHA